MPAPIPKPNVVEMKSYGFGLRGFKNFPELIPLVTFISLACGGACTFMAYALRTKPDVRLVKSREIPPWERVEPTETRKLYVNERQRKSVYVENAELAKLRKEIGSFKC